MPREPEDETMSNADKNDETIEQSETDAQLTDDTDPVTDVDMAEDEATDEDDTDRGNVRRLLPVHAAPNTGKNALKVSRQRGRPRKVERMPTTSDLEYNEAMSLAKEPFIENDPVYKAAINNSDSTAILHIIKAQVAREAAALEFQRIENEKFGKDTAQISTRRIDALMKFVNIELENKKLGGDLLDLRGEKFQAVFAFFIETIQTVAADVLSPEQVDLLFNRLGTALEGWEERAAYAVLGRGKDKK